MVSLLECFEGFEVYVARKKEGALSQIITNQYCVNISLDSAHTCKDSF